MTVANGMYLVNKFNVIYIILFAIPMFPQCYPMLYILTLLKQYVQNNAIPTVYPLLGTTLYRPPKTIQKILFAKKNHLTYFCCILPSLHAYQFSLHKNT